MFGMLVLVEVIVIGSPKTYQFTVLSLYNVLECKVHKLKLNTLVLAVSMNLSEQNVQLFITHIEFCYIHLDLLIRASCARHITAQMSQ
jgi:hypothetical protein